MSQKALEKQEYLESFQGPAVSDEERMANRKELNRDKAPSNSLESQRRQKNKIRARNRALLQEMFGRRCAHCHQAYPFSVFDYHHIDPTQKKKAISRMIPYASAERLREEAKKCIMLCANCHRLHHHPAGVWDE
jgi:hypothetical protein